MNCGRLVLENCAYRGCKWRSKCCNGPHQQASLYVSHQSQIEQMMQFDLNEMVDFSFQMARFDYFHELASNDAFLFYFFCFQIGNMGNLKERKNTKVRRVLFTLLLCNESVCMDENRCAGILWDLIVMSASTNDSNQW